MAKAQGDLTPDSIRQIVRQELQRTAPTYLKGDRLLCICADCFFAFLLGATGARRFVSFNERQG